MPSKDLTIKLNDVSFRYNEEQDFVLKDVCFEFKTGNVYAIVGKNGAGKTTLINLLCRFYDSDKDKGGITINGVDIREIPAKRYRENFSAIFQNFSNLAFTIKDNIILDKEFDHGFMKDLCNRLDISKGIEKMSDGIDTYLQRQLNKDGIILSGGQNQRIAIARALYRNAPVLILDEPSSALDPLAEDALIELIHKNAQDKIVIYVSHRLASAARADCVLFIDDNTIADAGKHSDLYGRSLAYKEFYDAQAKHYRN